MEEVHSERKSSNRQELEQLKCDLEKFRELLLPLNKVFEWEQNYYAAVVVGVITVIFALVWYLEPSLLTAVCVIGIVVSTCDFVIPLVLSSIGKSAEWNAVDQQKYEEICSRLQNAKQHVIDTVEWFVTLRATKPKLYLVLMLTIFTVMAWFGSLIDNLLLTYLIVVGLSLVPGLRKRGLLQPVTQKLSGILGGLGVSKSKGD